MVTILIDHINCEIDVSDCIHNTEKVKLKSCFQSITLKEGSLMVLIFRKLYFLCIHLSNTVIKY